MPIGYGKVMKHFHHTYLKLIFTYKNTFHWYRKNTATIRYAESIPYKTLLI